MAAMGSDFDEMLSIFCDELCWTRQCLDRMLQETYRQGSNIPQILKEELQERVSNQEHVESQFNQLKRQFLQSGDDSVHNLFQLHDEVLREINRKNPNDKDWVGFAAGIKESKKRVDQMRENVLDLMLDFDVAPPARDSKGKNITICLQYPPSDGKFKRKGGVMNTLRNAFVLKTSLTDVAVQLYGFPPDVASQIESSLQHRKLIHYEYFEAEDDADAWLQETAIQRSWDRVHKLDMIFHELKEKIFEKPEVADLKDAPEDLRVPFLRVVRNWVFHIESILFNLMYEFYHRVKNNETANVSFEPYWAKLDDLKETNNGMVPITVYKTMKMLENPGDCKAMGVVIKTPTVYRSGSKKLIETLEKNDLMNPVHTEILRLRKVLLYTSGISFAKVAITNDRSNSIATMLQDCIEKVQDIGEVFSWALSLDEVDAKKD